MYRSVFVLLAWQVFIFHTGCRAADQPVVRAGTSPPTLPSGEAERTEPQGMLTLREALALSLTHNPSLTVFPHALRAADARVLQAGLRPNPEFELEVEEFAGSGERSGFDAAETTIGLGLPIELGGKRDKRTRLAALGRDLVQWDYESARLDVIRETTKGFTAVLAAQDRLALAEQLLALSREAEAAVAQRVEAGRDSPVDALRAGVATSAGQIAVRRARGALATARHNLAAQWGGGAPTFDEAVGDLSEVWSPEPPVDVVAAIGDNPDIARWEAEQQQRRAALRLQKAQAVPDITIGGGVQRFEETDDSAFVFGLSVPIPLFDRNQGGIEEATANLGKAHREYEAAHVRTLAALTGAVRSLSVAYDEVLLLRDEVVPKARQAFEAAREGYRQGKFDYLYVLDAQRTLFETRAGYVDSLEAYHTARADVMRLTGGPVMAVPSDSLHEESTREHGNEK